MTAHDLELLGPTAQSSGPAGPVVQGPGRAEHPGRVTSVGRRGGFEHGPVGRRPDAFLIDFAFLFRISYMEAGGGAVGDFLPVREGDGGWEIQPQIGHHGGKTDLPVPRRAQIAAIHHSLLMT